MVVCRTPKNPQSPCVFAHPHMQWRPCTGTEQCAWWSMTCEVGILLRLFPFQLLPWGKGDLPLGHVSVQSYCWAFTFISSTLLAPTMPDYIRDGGERASMQWRCHLQRPYPSPGFSVNLKAKETCRGRKDVQEASRAILQMFTVSWWAVLSLPLADKHGHQHKQIDLKVTTWTQYSTGEWRASPLATGCLD